MPRLGEKITGLANGLNVLDGPEIKDYAAPYFLDEAATAPLLGNAKKIAAALVGPSSRDKTFKELVQADAPPSPQLVEESIALAFRKIVGRGPTAEENARFQAFHTKATTTGGHVTAGKALLTAVLLQPEVLYRSELGEGEMKLGGAEMIGSLGLEQFGAYPVEYAGTLGDGGLLLVLRRHLSEMKLLFDQAPSLEYVVVGKHVGSEVFQIESALLGLRVMAIHAIGFQQGKHVLVVSCQVSVCLSD